MECYGSKLYLRVPCDLTRSARNQKSQFLKFKKLTRSARNQKSEFLKFKKLASWKHQQIWVSQIQETHQQRLWSTNLYRLVVHGPLKKEKLPACLMRKVFKIDLEMPRSTSALWPFRKNKHTSTLWGITSTQGSAAWEFEKSAAIMEIEPMCLNNRCISPVRNDVLKWQSNSNVTRGKPKFSQKHASTPHGIQRQQQRNT